MDSVRGFGRIEKVYCPDIIKSASVKNRVCLNMDYFLYDFAEFTRQTLLIEEAN